MHWGPYTYVFTTYSEAALEHRYYYLVLLLQVKQHLSTSMPERYSRIEVGPVGQAARSIASGAAASIPEHEGLKNLQAATYCYL